LYSVIKVSKLFILLLYIRPLRSMVIFCIQLSKSSQFRFVCVHRRLTRSRFSSSSSVLEKLTRSF
jgi:hypothetical protein